MSSWARPSLKAGTSSAMSSMVGNCDATVDLSLGSEGCEGGEKRIDVDKRAIFTAVRLDDGAKPVSSEVGHWIT